MFEGGGLEDHISYDYEESQMYLTHLCLMAFAFTHVAFTFLVAAHVFGVFGELHLGPPL